MPGFDGEGSPPIQLEIREILEKGRGVFVQQEVPAGAFLLEYKTAEVYPCSQRKEKEEDLCSQ